MNDQVIMGASGQLGVAVPLYKHQVGESIESIEGYYIFLCANKPIGYLIDIGLDSLQFIDADALEKSVEFLGDL